MIESRYTIPPRFLKHINQRGFEVNVHDLNHDGHLFREREEFLRRAGKINRYLREFEAQGFRSGIMYPTSNGSVTWMLRMTCQCPIALMWIHKAGDVAP